MKRKAFDLQEAVVLLDLYLNTVKKGQSLTEAAEKASKRLRLLATKNGYSFDESFRSPQGLIHRIRSIASAFENNESRSAPATSVFSEAVSLYKNDRKKYDDILASESYGIASNKAELSLKEGSDHLLEGGKEKVRESERLFLQWISDKTSPFDNNSLLQSYAQINVLLMKAKVLCQPITETRSIDEIKAALGKTKQLFGNRRKREMASRLLSEYLVFLQDEAGDVSLSEVPATVENVQENASEQKSSNAQDLQSVVEQAILEADIEGITIDSLSKKIPSASIASLKRIRDHSDKIIPIYESMIHIDSLIGVENAAEQLHEIIEKLLIRNSGYVSSQQLFDYAYSEMQMFLNDNDFLDEQKVFCLVRFLFEKIDWHGYHYEFSSGRHISRSGNEAIKTNMDVFVKFARDQGGVFQWDGLLSYLKKVGIKPNNLRVQMEIGSKPIFFYYSSSGLISVESMKIDDYWFCEIKKALKRLFDDVGDHIVVRNIVPAWFEQLPELPQRVGWTPVLLQYVLHFYGEKLGARTIHSEMPQQYDMVHSLLVRDDSELYSFGDAVVAFVIDNNVKERHFQAEQLRRLLVYGKMIGELELIGNMPRAIGHDTRFAWDAAEENVFIRV